MFAHDGHSAGRARLIGSRLAWARENKLASRDPTTNSPGAPSGRALIDLQAASGRPNELARGDIFFFSPALLPSRADTSACLDESKQQARKQISGRRSNKVPNAPGADFAHGRAQSARQLAGRPAFA